MGKKWRRTWIKTINLDVIREESQEEDNKNDKDYIPEKKGRYEFNTFGKMNDDMPDEYKYTSRFKILRIEYTIHPNCRLNFTCSNVKLKEPL